MLTPRKKPPVLEAQRRVEPVMLHHAGQRAQHTTDWATMAPCPMFKTGCGGEGLVTLLGDFFAYICDCLATIPAVTFWFPVVVQVEEGYEENAGEWDGKTEWQLKQEQWKSRKGGRKWLGKRHLEEKGLEIPRQEMDHSQKGKGSVLQF